MDATTSIIDISAETTTLRHKPRFRWHPMAVFGLITFSLIVIASILAPFVAQYNPNEQDLRNRLKLPSATHILGTDAMGRDVFTRILYGGRQALLISFVAVMINATVGTVIGSIAARRAGTMVDEVIMRLIDLFLAFPGLIVSLTILVLLKPGFWPLVIALTVTGWTPYARLARAVGLEISLQTYIEAATATGESEFLMMRKHILPNTLGPILAQVFLRYGHTLLTIAGLSYLGIGIQPPTPDWGAMLSEAQAFMVRVPSLILTPGMTIFITTLSVTMAGQGLMLMFDPEQARTW
jgi:ABC-type dipeptide/oligopeptide/nickel transport system permease subunit